MIKASCVKYEDEEDGQGNVVMYYLVLVEDRFRQVKYTLHKRYSDFLQLKEKIHEKSDEVEAFRFPNKSIFNNRSRYDVDPSFSYFLSQSLLILLVFIFLSIVFRRMWRFSINFFFRPFCTLPFCFSSNFLLIF